MCKRGRNAFSRSTPDKEDVGKEKVWGGMSISAEVASPGGVGGSAAGAKRNGADGAWETSGIVEGKEGEAAGVTGDWAGGGGEVEEESM